MTLAFQYPALAAPDEHDFGHRRVTLPAGRLLVKRDDLTGLALGGNKVRKLEYLCADALARGARHLVTAGRPQSNHCRQTAAAATRLGLGCTVLLDGRAPGTFSGNLVLDVLFGATIRWIRVDPAAAGYLERLNNAVCAEADRLSAARTPAYPVPVGASTPLGAIGYVRAACELRAQVPDLVGVFCPSGSVGTHVGLVVGLGDYDLVQGVGIGDHHQEELVERLAAETAALARLPSPRGRARIDSRHGTATHTEPILEAIRLAARTDGLVLDPVCTGKAMVGLIAASREGALPADGSVVFLHTGGSPGLLASEHAEWLVDALAGDDRRVPKMPS